MWVGDVRITAGLFDRLADLIHSMEALNRNCQFVLIPGPHDISQGTQHCLPLPPLLDLLTARLKEKVENVTCATNPCRLRYYASEMVLFRADLLQKVLVFCFFCFLGAHSLMMCSIKFVIFFPL